MGLNGLEGGQDYETNSVVKRDVPAFSTGFDDDLTGSQWKVLEEAEHMAL